MRDSKSTLVHESNPDLAELYRQFLNASAKKQLALVNELAAAGEPGLALLQEFLLKEGDNPTLVVGKVYQTLYQAKTPQTEAFLQANFPSGVVPLRSEREIDYAPLQQLLAQQDFQAADRLTLLKQCELAGPATVQRKWLYFTEVENFPVTDLQTIDTLWRLHSEGKFGFSVQRELWLSLGKDFNKLWGKIGWKTGNNWTRYPNEFIWDLSAPRGHLPLTNQLRGVRVFSSLLNHPAWTT